MKLMARIWGSEELATGLAAAGDALVQARNRAVNSAAVFLAGRVRAEGFYQGELGVAQGPPKPDILTSRTGYLRASIRHELLKPGVAAVGPTARYGAIHEFGGRTGAHDIVPRRARALRFMVGNEVVFARRVHHPGSLIPARPYLRPAVQRHEMRLRQIMLDVLSADFEAALRRAQTKTGGGA